MIKNYVRLRSEISCGGCNGRIVDRFYLLAAEQAWHTHCLRCSKCAKPLDTALSCFSKDGNIYCKEDYLRLFSYRKCARCGTSLNSSDLVIKARDLIFHVDCFTCAVCRIYLSTGDTIAIVSGKVLCGEHYDVECLSDNDSPMSGCLYSRDLSSPRERSIDESSEIIDLHTNDGSQSSGFSSNLTNDERSKRMRTSFKHHQLRTMKSYFAINQNPDSKDLKQLAQKTGLSKRVLQVWFQNARAKWRKNVMHKDDVTDQLMESSNNVMKSSPNSNIETSMTPPHLTEDSLHMSFDGFH